MKKRGILFQAGANIRTGDALTLDDDGLVVPFVGSKEREWRVGDIVRFETNPLHAGKVAVLTQVDIRFRKCWTNITIGYSEYSDEGRITNLSIEAEQAGEK